MRIATYIRLKGQAEEAFDFYKTLFDGKVLMFEKITSEMTEDDSMIGKIFHAELEIDGFYLYMSDTNRDYDYSQQAYKITMECDSLDQAKRYAAALGEKGTVQQALEPMPWGIHLATMTDRFGVNWDIVYSE